MEINLNIVSINDRVTTEVMGWDLLSTGTGYLPGPGFYQFFSPMTSIADAWLVVQRIADSPAQVYIQNSQLGWLCEFEHERFGDVEFAVLCSTVEEAICLSALNLTATGKL